MPDGCVLTLSDLLEKFFWLFLEKISKIARRIFQASLTMCLLWDALTGDSLSPITDEWYFEGLALESLDDTNQPAYEGCKVEQAKQAGSKKRSMDDCENDTQDREDNIKND